MVSPEVLQLAENLKKNGLAASQEEAIRKAEMMLGQSFASQPEPQLKNPEPDSAEETDETDPDEDEDTQPNQQATLQESAEESFEEDNAQEPLQTPEEFPAQEAQEEPEVAEAPLVQASEPAEAGQPDFDISQADKPLKELMPEQAADLDEKKMPTPMEDSESATYQPPIEEGVQEGQISEQPSEEPQDANMQFQAQPEATPPQTPQEEPSREATPNKEPAQAPAQQTPSQQPQEEPKRESKRKYAEEDIDLSDVFNAN